MSCRWTHLRQVDPGTGLDVVERRWLNLWWAAVAAADETIQGGPLAPAWLRLFEAHLSCLRIPVKLITDSGVKPITDSGQTGHLSERSDAGLGL